jgi:hypothetical protein
MLAGAAAPPVTGGCCWGERGGGGPTRSFGRGFARNCTYSHPDHRTGARRQLSAVARATKDPRSYDAAIFVGLKALSSSRLWRSACTAAPAHHQRASARVDRCAPVQGCAVSFRDIGVVGAGSGRHVARLLSGLHLFFFSCPVPRVVNAAVCPTAHGPRSSYGQPISTPPCCVALPAQRPAAPCCGYAAGCMLFHCSGQCFE